MKPAQKRAVVRYFRAGFRVSERRACRLAGVARSSYRYRSVAADQTAAAAAAAGSRRDAGALRLPAACTSCCGARAGGSTTSGSTGSIARKGWGSG